MQLQDLENAVAASSFQINDETDQKDFLLLLQSGDAVVQAIEDEPDYIPAELLPLETKEPRTFSKVTKADNPLGAWSHKATLKAKHNTSTLLEGRTIVLKDNICVGGLPTTIGTFAQLISANEQFPVSPIDATVVRRILEAGGRIKGTATCENYSACPLSYSSATGPVHNPHLKGYTTGGSSSGPGALVAAHGLQKPELGETVEMAIGGDQGGSIRIPASYCGIYGLKPTHGLVPYTGVASLFPMLDHVGPMCNSVRDVATLLQVIAGYDGFDPRMTAEAPLRSQVKNYPSLLQTYMEQARMPSMGASLKIGLLKESFAMDGMSPIVRHMVYVTAKDYFTAAGASVREISVPLHSQGPAIWTAATRASMSDFAFAGRLPGYLSFQPPHLRSRWPMDQEMFDLLTATNPAVPNLIIAGEHLKKKYGPHVEGKAHRKVFQLRAAYDAAFEEVDVLVTPCMPTVAMPHPRMKFTDLDGTGSSVMDKISKAIGSTSNTCPFNVTGHPAMSVPCGFARPEDDGTDVKLPVGMQLIAKRWDEETLLKAAAIFESVQAPSPS